MTIRRFDQSPDLRSLREALYKLLEENVLTQQASAVEDPPLDLAESRDLLVARLALPGVQPDDIDVTITGAMLTVRGELREPAAEPGTRYHHREQRYGTFSRRITLPVAVQADAMRAEYEHGMLTLTMPKLEQAQPRTITISRLATSLAIESAAADGEQPGDA